MEYKTITGRDLNVRTAVPIKVFDNDMILLVMDDGTLQILSTLISNGTGTVFKFENVIIRDFR